MMRRNDFRAIAETLRVYYTNGSVDKVVLRDMVDNMCNIFRQSNPAFDRSKFLRTCGFYNE